MINGASESASAVRIEPPSSACPGRTETEFERYNEIEARYISCAEPGFPIGAVLHGSRLLAISCFFF